MDQANNPTVDMVTAVLSQDKEKIDLAAAKKLLQSVANKSTCHSIIFLPESREFYLAFPKELHQAAANGKWHHFKWTDFLKE